MELPGLSKLFIILFDKTLCVSVCSVRDNNMVSLQVNMKMAF